MSGVSTVPRIVVLTTAIVAIASLTYHVVEKPVRYGTIGKQLNARRIALVLPAVLAALIAINISVVVPHAGAEIPATTKTGASGARVTKTVILVGDSVPRRSQTSSPTQLPSTTTSSSARPREDCPATAVEKVYSSGTRFKNNICPPVATEQNNKVEKYRPALVIWWSRYELAPRLGPDGKVLPLGSKGVPAGAAGLVREASARADEARSASRHGADRASRPGACSPEPRREAVPHRSDAPASTGRRERLERIPRPSQGPGRLLDLDRPSGLP